MRPSRLIGPVLTYAALAVVVLFYLGPILWIAVSSVQPQGRLTSVPPSPSFAAIQFDNYHDLLGSAAFRGALQRTILVTLGATAGVLLLAIPTAYAAARLQFRGKLTFLVSILIVQLGPAVAFLIPLFILMRGLRLIDTYVGLILVFVAFVTPIGVWLLRGFFENLPPQLERAARMDGCSRFGAFWRIMVPLAGAGIGAVALVAFIAIWGDLLIPLTLTFSRQLLTVYASAFSGEHIINYGGAAATAVISALPTVLLVIVFRRFLIRGLTEGAVKQ